MSPRPPPALIRGSLASGKGVLLLGLFRSGSKSLYHAMQILGYEHVHHASEDHDDDSWDRIAEAAQAIFPILNQTQGKPKPRDFEKADWDRVFGEFQAVSDIAAVFAPELIAAYPGAKVVLVQRDFGSWFASVDTVFISSILDPRRKLMYDLVVWPVRKLHFYVGLRSVCMGLFGAPRRRGQGAARGRFGRRIMRRSGGWCPGRGCCTSNRARSWGGRDSVRFWGKRSRLAWSFRGSILGQRGSGRRRKRKMGL